MNGDMRTVLLAGGEAKLLEMIEAALKSMGHSSVAARSGKEALKALREHKIHMILSELRQPDLCGRDLLERAKDLAPGVPVVIMSANAPLKDAVAIVKEGAFDYIEKPVDLGILQASVTNALRFYAENAGDRRIRKEIRTIIGDDFIGKSPAIQEVRQRIRRVSTTLANVLITGESGTGKEVVAKLIHLSGTRTSSPFVAINCAAIPETLLESELFGHVKGAFTGATASRQGRFAQADNGTIFLDEIGDMPLALQAKILRCIQEKTIEPVGSQKALKVDARIIAATNIDLTEALGRGVFRQDLYYRLNVYHIALPSLRERREDIPLLVEHFAKKYAAKMGGQAIMFTEDGMQGMLDYYWPGNIRELENCVERLSIIAPGGMITPHTLAASAVFADARKVAANFSTPELVPEAEPEAAGERPAFPLDLEQRMEDLERELIMQALEVTGGMQVKAAELLHIANRNVRHRIKKLGITVRKSRPILPHRGPAFPLELDRLLEELERKLLMQALEEAEGVQVKAAELLSISKHNILYRIKKLGITVLVKRTAHADNI